MVQCACCSLHGAWSGLQVCCVLHGAYSSIAFCPFHLVSLQIVVSCTLYYRRVHRGIAARCIAALLIAVACTHRPLRQVAVECVRAAEQPPPVCRPGGTPVSTQDTPPVSLSTPEVKARRNRRRRLHQQGRRPINQERTERSAAQSWRGRECAGVGRRRRPASAAHMLTTRDVSHREMSPLNLTAPSNICAHVPANGSRRRCLCAAGLHRYSKALRGAGLTHEYASIHAPTHTRSPAPST